MGIGAELVDLLSFVLVDGVVEELQGSFAAHFFCSRWRRHGEVVKCVLKSDKDEKSTFK